jgi:hypothetical protein
MLTFILFEEIVLVVQNRLLKLWVATRLSDVGINHWVADYKLNVT